MSILLTKNKKRLLLGCCYIYMLMSFSITSCQCGSHNKKSTEPSETVEDIDTKTTNDHDQLTMEVDKHILLGNDKEFVLTFHTLNNKTPEWNNYRLKISLEASKEKADNKISFFKDSIELQTSIDKQLSDFTDLTDIHTQHTWQLAFNLHPSLTCNEIIIKIELLANENVTPIKIEKINWKNIQLNFKNLCYNPITGILTCIIENITDTSVEDIKLKHSIQGESTATLNNISDIDSFFTLQPLSQKKLEFKLDFNQSDTVELIFELWYKGSKIVSQPIILKDIQISIEGVAENQTFRDDQVVTAWIKNKGAHAINTSELIIQVIHPFHVALVLSDKLGNHTQLKPCEFNLSDIVGEKEIVHGDSIPFTLKLFTVTNQAETTINLVVRASQITYIEPLANRSFIWTLTKQDSCPNSSNQNTPNTTPSSNAGGKTYNQVSSALNTDLVPNQPETPSAINSKLAIENSDQTFSSINGNTEQSLPAFTKKDQPTSTCVSKATISDSTTYTPNLSDTSKNNEKEPSVSSSTYIPADLKQRAPKIADGQLNKHQDDLENISELIDELYLTPLDNKDELTKLIEITWKAMQELNLSILEITNHHHKEATNFYTEVTTVYQKAAKAYGSICIQLMDTELSDLLPSLAEKAESIAKKAHNITNIVKTKDAYTATSKAYSYAAMGHMACCKNSEANFHAQQAFELANHASNTAFKATTKEAYTYATTAYCYAALANNYLFYAIQQEEIDKLIAIAKHARKAANNANFTANLCKTDTAYTDAARAYAGVANMYSTLANHNHGTQIAKESIKIAKYTAQTARIMANKTNTYLAKAAAEDAEKAIDNLPTGSTFL